VVSTVQHNSGNHYHLMAEVLSRIIVVRKYLTSNFPGVKLLLQFGGGLRSQMEQLIDILKIKKEEYLEYVPSKDSRFYFTNFWTVDWRAKNISQVVDAWSVYFPPRSVLRLTSSTILEAVGLSDVSPSHSSDWSVLYISRNDTGIRTVKNESLLVEALRKILGNHLRIFFGKITSFRDQIYQFNAATVVIGPHGAALGNLLWCRDQTSVIQFPLNPHVDTCFAHLAAAKNLDYWLIPKLSSYYYGQFYMNHTHVTPIVELVVSLLERRGIKIGEKEEL